MALEDHKLPEDVVIGCVTFRAGVSLATLVGAARRWHEGYRATVLECMAEALKHDTAIEAANGISDMADKAGT